MMKSYKNIPAYIANFPKSVQALLKQMRATIQKAAPQATETISYGIPTFKLNGNLVHFGAFKTHVSFFPGSSGVKAFKKELAKYETSKGTIQFPADKKLPLALIARITKFRVQENTSKGSPKARGAYVHYHKDGTVWAKGNLSNGKMSGYWEWFRKDGSKMRSGHFKGGVQAGEWITYDKKGRTVT